MQEIPASVKICPKCDKEMSKDIVYCPYDGSLLKPKYFENTCGKCNKQYDNTYKFCPIHGDALSNIKTESINTVDEIVLNSFTRSVCPNCGFNNNTIDFSTCPKCGIVISKYKGKKQDIRKEEENIKYTINEMGQEEWECACGISNKKIAQVCGGCGWTKKQVIDYLLNKSKLNKDKLNDNNITNTNDNSGNTRIKIVRVFAEIVARRSMR